MTDPKPVRLPRSPEPMQYAGCYTLDLYCDRWAGRHDPVHGFGRPHAQFNGRTFAECARQARRRGWRLHLRTQTATCPRCTRPAEAAGR